MLQVAHNLCAWVGALVICGRLGRGADGDQADAAVIERLVRAFGAARLPLLRKLCVGALSTVLRALGHHRTMPLLSDLVPQVVIT